MPALEETLAKLSLDEQNRLLRALRVVRRGYRTNRFIKAIRPNLHPKQEMFLSLGVRELMAGGAAGGSKVLYDDGEILTPFGFWKGRKLKVGSLVNNPDGSISRVIQLHSRQMFQVWRVHFHDGTHTDVGREHLWLAWRSGKRKKVINIPVFGIDAAEVIETAELKNWSDTSLDQQQRGVRPEWPCIPLCEPQRFNIPNRTKCELDPYLLGIWIGDGHCTNNIGLTVHKDDLPNLEKALTTDGGNWSLYQKKGTEVFQVSFKGDYKIFWRDHLACASLDDRKSYNKFIPEDYRNGSIETRLAILQGLMDTDGTVDKRGHLSFATTSLQLAENVRFIVQSLGGTATVSDPKPGSYKDENGVEVICRDVYSIYIKLPNEPQAFRLERKKSRCKTETDCMYRRVVKVEILKARQPGRCITVSHRNGLYLTNDFIVTHNSDMLLLGALQYADVPGFSAILLRRNWPDLTKKGALISRADDWFSQFPEFHRKEGGRAWEIEGGGTIAFGYVENMKDVVNKYQSAEFQYIAVDEVTQHDIRVYLYLFSRLRRLKDVSIPLRMRSGTNPGGTFGQEYKNRFVTAARAVPDTWMPQPDIPDRENPDEEWAARTLSQLLDAQNPPEIPDREYLDCLEDEQFSWLWNNSMVCPECRGRGKRAHNGNKYQHGGTDCVYCAGKGQQNCYFLPARLQDNPSLDADEYRQSLILLPPTERLQLERGRWDVTIEGHLFKESWIRNFEYSRGSDTIVNPALREKPPSDQDEMAKLLHRSASNFHSAAGVKVYRRKILTAEDWLDPNHSIQETEEHIDFITMERLQIFSTADTASKDDSHHDHSAIGVWGLDYNTYDLYLLHVMHEKLEVPDILPAILHIHQAWNCEFCIIEDAASGIGVIQSAGRQAGRGLTVLPFSPHIHGKRVNTNAKVSRATVSMIRMRGGKVFFPIPRPYWWGDFQSELLMFGTEEWKRLQKDDQVDMFSMASWYASNKDNLDATSPIAGQAILPGPPAYGFHPQASQSRNFPGVMP